MVRPATASELTAGSLVAGRFRLEGRLGQGGMGTVWAARNTLTGRPVALKLLRPELVDDEHRTRFLREARAACSVLHPSVCEVLDVVESNDGVPVLVLERLAGEPLSARLGREGKLPLALAARVLAPVASAIGAAHAAGVIHRDLKPQNLFLLQGGGVKVLDFGIAKLLGEDVAEADRTGTGVLLGTPSYMSPEQIFGERDVDQRADVWALGLILYEVLTGILPTRAENVGQVLKTVLTRPIRPVTELEPTLPADLAELLGRMLSRRRSERPAELRGLCAMLAGYGGVELPAFESPAAAAFDGGPPTMALGGETTRSAIEVRAPISGRLAPSALARRTRARLAVAAVALGTAATVWLTRSAPPELADDPAPAPDVSQRFAPALPMPVAAAPSGEGAARDRSPAPSPSPRATDLGGPSSLRDVGARERLGRAPSEAPAPPRSRASATLAAGLGVPAAAVVSAPMPAPSAAAPPPPDPLGDRR